MKTINTFTSLVKDSPEANKAIMMTLLKVATKYYKENKKLFVPKWTDFFVSMFPKCTYTFKAKEGPKVPALTDAATYLVEKGFAEMVEVSGKDYRLFQLKKDSIEKINNALDKDTLSEVDEDALFENIDEFYAKSEKSKTSEASKLSFDEMFS